MLYDTLSMNNTMFQKRNIYLNKFLIWSIILLILVKNSLLMSILC